MEASYSIVQKDNEYRILLTSVNIEVLPDHILNVLTSRNIDVSELMIERISGESTTGQEILHDITAWVAELFACNPNLIIYYSCDDMTPQIKTNIIYFIIIIINFPKRKIIFFLRTQLTIKF